MAEAEYTADDLHAAIHEAAHCVVGYHFGWTLTPGSGISISEGVGHCFLRLPRRDQGSFREIQQALAGWAGEMVMWPEAAKRRARDDLKYILLSVRNCQLEEDEEDSDDACVFRILVSGRPGASEEELIAEYEGHTDAVLAILREPENLEAVKRLARVLLDARHIGDASRVEAIFAGAGATV